MTYPQYAPPAQPQAQPYPQYPVYGQPAPAYAPAPQSAPPAQPQPQSPSGGQGIVPPPPTLRDGGTTGGAASPKMRHLVGRTIVVVPIRVDETKTNTIVGSPNFGTPQPEAYFDLIVCDGGPLQYGDNQSRNPNERHPNTHEIDTPCVFRNANDYGFGFVQATRDALANGEPGRVGVVQQGTKGNFPYLLTKTGEDVHGNERPDGQQRFELAMQIFGQYWTAKHGGAPFPNPTARSLIAAPPAGAAPQVNYGPPPVATQHPTVAQPPAYGGIPAPTYPAGQTYGAPQQPVSAPAPAFDPAQFPPPVAAWLASLPAEQQAASAQQYLAQQGQQPAPVGAGTPATVSGPGI